MGTNDVGFSIWKVPDGTTTTDTKQKSGGILSIAEANMREARLQGENLPDQTYEMVVELDTSGSWILNCWNDLADYPAIAFTVTDN